MTRVLFWNLNRKDLHRAVAALAKDKCVDLVLLAEAGGAPDAYRQSLGYEVSEAPFEIAFTLAGKQGEAQGRLARIHILIKHSRSFWITRFEDPRFVIASYAPPARKRLLFAVAHLQSQAHLQKASVNFACRKLAESIREQEGIYGNDRTVVVGDLNLNPFDEGVVGADGLHGVASRDLAKRPARKVAGRFYDYFYNPMWGLFGDRHGVPGSYFYSNGEPITQFWHLFDQVLLRPGIIPEFVDSSLEIVTEIRSESLLAKRGEPDKVNFSDHLPLIFEID